MRRFTAAVATVTAFAFLGEAALTAASSLADNRGADSVSVQQSGGGDGRAKFVDRHGLVLRNELLYLIYWGSAWTKPSSSTPTAELVTSAASRMIASAYMTGLAQYRDIGHGAVRGSQVLASSEPPAVFTDEQVREFVHEQIAAGTVPGPDADDQTLYVVVMPPDVKPANAAWEGEHNYYGKRGHRIHYAWLANTGSLTELTGIMSHEIVEAATDPEGTGFLGVHGTCDGNGWCEIADICRQQVWSIMSWSGRIGRTRMANASFPASANLRHRPPVPDPGDGLCRRGPYRRVATGRPTARCWPPCPWICP